MPVSFTKYSGCGNDFILIDNRQLDLFPSKQAIVHLCHRQQGIGGNGLIFLENSTNHKATYRMRIFNADGSEAEMCGNGVRCLANYIRSIEPIQRSFNIETMHAILPVSFQADLVQVTLPPPKEISLKKIWLQQKQMTLHCMDTGVPHAVYFADDSESKALFLLASSIRFHEAFHPRGTNVNFATILSDQSVAVRTYERGVEEETLACGTGAVAVAIASTLTYQLCPPIKIRTRSNDCLDINFQGNISHLTNVVMTGPANKIFEGCVDIKMFGFQLKSSPSFQ